MASLLHSRTDAELEHFFIFCMCVAGKSAKAAKMAVRRLLNPHRSTPFGYLGRKRELIRARLERARTGKYGLLSEGLEFIVDKSITGAELRTMTLEELEEIPGVGFKTSRFFVVYSREGARHAVLDTHILAYLRTLGYDAPRQTPGKRKQYIELENVVLGLADEAGVDPVDFDDPIWQERSGGG